MPVFAGKSINVLAWSSLLRSDDCLAREVKFYQQQHAQSVNDVREKPSNYDQGRCD